MFLVFSSPDLEQALVVKSLLEKSGIAAHVFNENISRMPGTLFNRAPSAWPRVEIEDCLRLEQAKSVIEDYEQELASSGSGKMDVPDWECPKCKEQNVSSFEVCWNVGLQTQKSGEPASVALVERFCEKRISLRSTQPA